MKYVSILILILILILIFLQSAISNASELSNTNKSYIGVSLFTPGAMNVVAGKALESTTIKVTYGHLSTATHGIEIGATVLRQPTKELRSVQIIAGTSSTNSVLTNSILKWTYVGVSTTIQNGSFFVEPGLTVGSGDFSSPQFSLQVGLKFDL
ncbi:MAG: hypothetical protein OEX12_13860 [Gammaproteobacteria bacterium]|nr:hypothetical protein [Gammaproteobacteria bacterium]